MCVQKVAALRWIVIGIITYRAPSELKKKKSQFFIKPFWNRRDPHPPWTKNPKDLFFSDKKISNWARHPLPPLHHHPFGQTPTENSFLCLPLQASVFAGLNAQKLYYHKLKVDGMETSSKSTRVNHFIKFPRFF